MGDDQEMLELDAKKQQSKQHSQWGDWNPGRDLRRAGCRINKFFCEIPCHALRVINVLKKGVLWIAKLAILALKWIIIAVSKLISLVIQAVQIDVEVGGALSAQRFDFMTKFNLKLLGLPLRFELRVNFNWATVRDLIAAAWNSVKNWFEEKVAGLRKILNH
eukprot:TRINITY_DN1570_c0_g1_i5.p1 TRINITY_DN1570_c0_g1~~TRINITY_DN1570_c0_g1_i5.p1  ORF type:complete len:172 (+),score=75.62 TRINITY_DN1570_c0_g1_i5:33-518(+)